MICILCMGRMHRSGASDEWIHDRWRDLIRCFWFRLTSGGIHGG